MNHPHRTYKEIKQEFSPEMREKIGTGAEQIRAELKIISTVRQTAGLTQEELADLID